MLASLFKALFDRRAGRRAESSGTSLSDTGSYTAACMRAATEPEFFRNFRQDLEYTRILEHVSEPLGEAYMDLIRQNAPILAAMDAFKLNDRFGNPRMFDFPPAGMVSPTTLRYIKVLADLKAYFGSLDGLNICEIGVGYGGQCRIVNALYRPASYCLIDLRPALALAKRFLGNFELAASLSFKAMDELDGAPRDLVISNYAFTELARPVQDEYLSKVILKAKRGYITYNQITPAEFNSYKADELLEMIPGATRTPEEPLFTHPDNCIIRWGMERAV